MSADYNGLLVTFEKALSEQHVELICRAILLIKKVIDVRPIAKNNAEYVIAKEQAKNELRTKVLDIFYEEDSNG